MTVLATNQFDVFVSVFPTNPQQTLFVPVVSVILRDQQKPSVNMTTSEKFPNILDAERCGIEMAWQWIRDH
jgi:hypothetical protein